MTQNIPLSKGYLAIDLKKCTGCRSCMLACSLAHGGQSSLSLSRIQVMDDSFGSFPNDIEVAACQQCENPACYLACPLKDEAFRIDEKTGARYIDEENCTGCQACIDACTYRPSRIGLDPEKNVAIKCDLCRSTPHWKSAGQQACVAICPVKAIRLVAEKPDVVNLRGEGWARLGLPTD